MKKQFEFKTTDDIVAYFQPEGGEIRFSEFQKMCSDLCEAMGFKVKARPKANGQGYKLELQFGSEAGLIECLCYRPDIEVPRTVIQNLTKENPDIDASHMIVITTSSFSPGAEAYCQGTGIRAVDSQRLLGLLKKHDFILERHVERVEVPVAPPDLRERKPVKQKAEPVAAPVVVCKSPLAARTSVQEHKPRSQGFNARQYMQQGRQNVKPFR